MNQVQRRKEKPSSWPPPWTELPNEITANILHRLGPVEMLETAQKVCTTWRRVCKDPSMWRVIDMWNLGDFPYIPSTLGIICRHAVDMSQGQLVAINIKHIANDELLDYIAQRSRKLRCLRLANCICVYDRGLIEAIKRFPLLEELQLILTPIYYETLETIGRSCPLLKSFALNDNASRMVFHKPDLDAFAIARSMPELRHLQLVGNPLSNVGLEAILDGCPHLESLDIRRCDHVRLTRDLENKLSARIKCIRYPYNSTSDYGWHVDDFTTEGNPCSDFDSSEGSEYDDDYDQHEHEDDYPRSDHEDVLYP